MLTNIALRRNWSKKSPKWLYHILVHLSVHHFLLKCRLSKSIICFTYHLCNHSSMLGEFSFFCFSSSLSLFLFVSSAVFGQIDLHVLIIFIFKKACPFYTATHSMKWSRLFGHTASSYSRTVSKFQKYS